jgi:D-glucosaminate-6-phosphate ammonia-lyase
LNRIDKFYLDVTHLEGFPVLNPTKRLFPSRRGLLLGGGLLAGGQLLPAAKINTRGAAVTAAHSGPLTTSYESLGVRPLINCKGTFTIISGSQSLTEVKTAMAAASRHYVNMDELMGAVSKRLAELTQAEWGIVTAGCAAALTHATAACIAGANPERMQRLPDLTGLKNEVIMPKYSRNEYDHAVRMLGVKIIEVETAEQLQRAFHPNTAMVLVLSCPAAENGPLSIPEVAKASREHRVPMIVDAAAENLTIPNIHLAHGATMVAYSGGKILRGPQCAGLLLGPRDLLQAAWLNSAPHHAFGRSLKVGKEEIMGMLTAVECWVKRDHEAEWKLWQSWLDVIDSQVTKITGVTTSLRQPVDLSNHAPELIIRWDRKTLGITGEEAQKILLEGEPRIIFGGATGSRSENSASSLAVMPYMMMPGDSEIVARKLHALLSNPPALPASAAPAPSTPAINISGAWDAQLTFVSGTSAHKIEFEQNGAQLTGIHLGETLSGDIVGVVEGRDVRFRSSHHIEGTNLHYSFSGTLNGSAMSGEVALGEYGSAHWTATRHAYRALHEDS